VRAAENRLLFPYRNVADGFAARNGQTSPRSHLETPMNMDYAKLAMAEGSESNVGIASTRRVTVSASRTRP